MAPKSNSLFFLIFYLSFCRTLLLNKNRCAEVEPNYRRFGFKGWNIHFDRIIFCKIIFKYSLKYVLVIEMDVSKNEMDIISY